MSKNKVIKRFDFDGTLKVPAGVTRIRVRKSFLPTTAIARQGATGFSSTSSQLYMLPFRKGRTDQVFGSGTNIVGYTLLGDNTVVSKSSPVAIPGITGAFHLADSGQVLDNEGKVYTWGQNVVGFLGDGTLTTRSSPVLVAGNWFVRDMGATHMLTVDGLALTWGTNAYGECGTGFTGAPQSFPVAVIGGIRFKKFRKAVQLAVGLSSTGDLYTWGNNNQGQLGDGTILSRSSPVAVIGGRKWKDFDFVWGPAGDFTGDNQVYGVDAQGDLYGWGGAFGAFGLGNGNTLNYSSPTLIIGGQNIKKVLTMIGSMHPSGHTMALTEDGRVYAWGWNDCGQLGDGTFTNSSTPVLAAGTARFVDIWSNRNGGWLGITADNKVYACGDVTGVFTDFKSTPTQVIGAFGDTWARAHMGVNSRSCALIDMNSRVYTMGQNNTGGLGDGTSVTKSSPVAVVGNYFAPVSPVVEEMQIDVTPGETIDVKPFGGWPSVDGKLFPTPFVDFVEVEFEA